MSILERKVASWELATTSGAPIAELERVDWSFSSLTNSGLHSFHWYPATYLAAIPGTLIPYLTSPSGIVLDPFCGSGTTGVEAVRLSRRFVGIDTNPVALLMSEAKLAFVSPQMLRATTDKVIQESQGIFGNGALPDHPRHQELLRWYHPQTVDALNRLLSSILQVESRLVRNSLLAIFSAILKGCSSQGRHWGWVCDNVTPRANEIIYKDAAAAFADAARAFSQESDRAFRAAQVHSGKITRDQLRKQSALMGGDCVQRLKTFEPSSIDLIVTSPPYYGVADYVKSQRLSYLWFDRDELASQQLGFRSFEELRSMEAGARSNRHRKNSHELYIAFMASFFQECSRVLKEDATLALVVGESSSRAATIGEIVSLAERAGFVLNSRLGRNIKATRRRLMAKVKGEEILVFGA